MFEAHLQAEDVEKNVRAALERQTGITTSGLSVRMIPFTVFRINSAKSLHHPTIVNNWTPVSAHLGKLSFAVTCETVGQCRELIAQLRDEPLVF